MRVLVSGGTVVNAYGSMVAAVLVDGELIAAVGQGLASSAGAAKVDRTIDAAGRLVIPGAIDVHTHMELPFGGTFAKDTFETGTRAAAFGGTTTIIDFAVQSRSGPQPDLTQRTLARSCQGRHPTKVVATADSDALQSQASVVPPLHVRGPLVGR